MPARNPISIKSQAITDTSYPLKTAPQHQKGTLFGKNWLMATMEGDVVKIEKVSQSLFQKIISKFSGREKITTEEIGRQSLPNFTETQRKYVYENLKANLDTIQKVSEESIPLLQNILKEIIKPSLSIIHEPNPLANPKKTAMKSPDPDAEVKKTEKKVTFNEEVQVRTFSDIGEFHVPERRYPPLSRVDTIIGGKSAHNQIEFIKEDRIIRKFPIEFQPAEKGRPDQMIAKAENGKHIVLQQAIRSCVPSAIAMLVLDRKKEDEISTFDLDLIENTNLASREQAKRFISDAGFTPLMTEGIGEDKVQFLSDLIEKNGPGVLSIDQRGGISGHVVVLDEINAETATIRDPYHGWMVTIPSQDLLEMVNPNCYFLQIQKPTLSTI